MRLTKLRAYARGFIARHIIADEPNHELSRLDRLDGRKQQQ